MPEKSSGSRTVAAAAEDRGEVGVGGGDDLAGVGPVGAAAAAGGAGGSLEAHELLCLLHCLIRQYVLITYGNDIYE